MHVLILTAGGAGMFCGSCMHDNTWARALIREGAEVTLLPTYTPVLVDENNLSDQHVFLGGINIYLDYKFPIWKRAPRVMKRWLDSPWLLKYVSKLSGSQDASKLGPLTLAMLDNEKGPLVAEMDELAHFIKEQVRPDIIVFSNALLAGILKPLKEKLDVPVCCVLQGDDIFLDGLLPQFREKAIQAVSTLARDFDHILVHSEFYRDFMSGYLQIDREKMELLPLGIDMELYADCQPRHSKECRKLGFFARIAPEKGLHNLVDAYLILLPEFPDLELLAGGYLHPRHHAYLEEQVEKVNQAGGNFQYLGSPKLVEEKVAMFQQFDIFSVPTDYQEPKGLSVLEAIASGLMVVQPDHGAFPEILRKTQGGSICVAGMTESLADSLREAISENAVRWNFAENGHQRVRESYSSEAMARRSLELFDQYIKERNNPTVSS
ncbi:D-inositol 3-phosphate glycosyltransferase [Polystyrenella longa]|uniref:D-inositol 3-phosphate glycosyltransferase n=1 Tax=Polystyrenella longa TaxID=2528007 RepID=A0A518CR52_9PLAN|nr:glycosyltransferase family 4 protein [Polystyrenella longa]QDU81709.1 D-inositol 3-phosphate glycosyltransferase [Polystyrenella longa]